jgi:predicted ArsR family transcriptional regulator
MSVKLPKVEGGMTESKIVELIRDSDYPVLTAKQISDAFEVTRQGVHPHMNELVEKGDLERMEVGSSAVVYYPPDDYSLEAVESEEPGEE